MALTNKVALVTGASRGIGRAITLRVARDGASVIVHYRDNADAAREVVAAIEADGGRALAVAADIADIGAVCAMFDTIASTFPALDILVNNAGTAQFDRLEDVTEAQYDAVFGLNVRGLLFTTQEAAKRLNDGGRIVNISSGITRVNSPGASVYAASKAAVEAFTRCWAAELGPRGITVNTVSPGVTETDMMRQVMPPEVLDEILRHTPLGRFGQPADIADVVAFLCSDEARWLTAQNVLANGGVG